LQVGEQTVVDLVRQTQRELIEVFKYEQTSLAVAQRQSGISGDAPLFSALFNYRHSTWVPNADWGSEAVGIRVVARQVFTNYPITMSVDDLGNELVLTAQTDRRIDPCRLIDYMRSGLESLLDALERAPHTRSDALSILPDRERRQVLHGFNDTAFNY